MGHSITSQALDLYNKSAGRHETSSSNGARVRRLVKPLSCLSVMTSALRLPVSGAFVSNAKPNHSLNVDTLLCPPSNPWIQLDKHLFGRDLSHGGRSVATHRMVPMNVGGDHSSLFTDQITVVRSELAALQRFIDQRTAPVIAVLRVNEHNPHSQSIIRQFSHWVMAHKGLPATVWPLDHHASGGARTDTIELINPSVDRGECFSVNEDSSELNRGLLRLGFASLPSDDCSIVFNSSLNESGITVPRRFIVPTLSVEERALLESCATFKAHGVSEREAGHFVRHSREGQALIELMIRSGQSVESLDDVTMKRLQHRATRYVQTGSNVPVQRTSERPLVKIVPVNNRVSDYSPFFTTYDQLEWARESHRPLSDLFGLPAMQDSNAYCVFEIAPKSPATIFESVIAPTSELNGRFQTQGGATQYIVPDRGRFTSPVFIGVIEDTFASQRCEPFAHKLSDCF